MHVRMLWQNSCVRCNTIFSRDILARSGSHCTHRRTTRCMQLKPARPALLRLSQRRDTAFERSVKSCQKTASCVVLRFGTPIALSSRQDTGKLGTSRPNARNKKRRGGNEEREALAIVHVQHGRFAAAHGRTATSAHHVKIFSTQVTIPRMGGPRSPAAGGLKEALQH